MHELRFVRAHILLVALLFAVRPSIKAGESFNGAYLSEFLVDREHGLKDEDGEKSGWVEVYNGSTAQINLSGWFLTDTTTNLTKWRFPGVVLLPDKYITVFASGKGRTNDLAHLHTNFRLGKSETHLALVGPATNIVSELAGQAGDGSYGRVRGEPSIHGKMPRPTPGRPNPSSGPGFAPDVVFSRNGGTFTNSFTLDLAPGRSADIPARSAQEGTVIHYTLDGRLPTSRSPVYTAPLSLTNTAYVRARCYQKGLLPGPPRSEAFLQLSTDALGFTSTLPVLVMDTFGKSTPTSSQGSFVHVSLFEPIKGKTSLTNAPTLATRAGFRVRGSTSSGFRQSPFAVKFLDEFNEERHAPLLDLPADSDWVLYGPNDYDLVMIHNPFVHQLSRDMGRYSPRTRFVEVFVVRGPGPVKAMHYNGLYVLTEKVKIARHRVNIDRLGGDDLKPPDVTGGYLLKFDRLGPGENGVFAAGDRGMIFVEPKEQTILLPQRSAQRQYLETFLRDFERALQGPNWKDPVLGYRAFLDVDAAIDFHVLEVLSGNVDAMVLSTYFHKPREGKIVCGPHWDFDRALGSTDGRDANPREWNTGPFFGGAWWPRLFSDPDFWQKWVDRWQELRRTTFSTANLNVVIDRLCNEVREAQPREYSRWNLQPRGGSFQSEIDLMKAWLASRTDFIDQQLVQPPILKVDKNVGALTNTVAFLSFSVPTNVTVYYTLDGSDPRLSQGATSSAARKYTGRVPLQPDNRIVARAHNTNRRQEGGPPTSTPWSAPVKWRKNE